MLPLGYYSSANLAIAQPGSTAVKFDGTNDYLSRDGGLTGASDGNNYLISFWIKPLSDDNTEVIYHSYQGGSGLLLTRQSNNEIRCIVSNSSAGQVQSVRSSIKDITIANGWRHVLISGKSVTPIPLFCQMYIDDVDVSSAVDDGAGTIDFTKTQHRIGANASSGSNKFNGCLSEVYLNFSSSLDLSVESNRRKFIDASGNPVDLGTTGMIPTGTSPIIYLSGDDTSFQTNKGTGGGFTVTGALTNCVDAPA